jgi:hypothetical protein
VTREQAATWAARLKAQGVPWHEAIDTMGVSKSYYYELLNDPDATKVRQRKAKAGGTCIDCGGPTAYDTGGPAERCSECRDAFERDRDPIERAAAKAHPGRLRWSDEAILAALRSVAGPDGVLSTNRYEDARAAGRDLPSRPLIFRYFDTWHNAVAAAGLKFAVSRSGGPARRCTREACVAALRHVGDELGRLPSVHEYNAYRALEEPSLPCVSSIQNRCGGWARALSAAASADVEMALAA